MSTINNLPSTDILQAVKTLTDNIQQKITANLRFKTLDSDFSVYSFEGKSKVNTPYSFDITFISEEEMHIESMLDDDIELYINDENSQSSKYIYGKVFKAIEQSVVGSIYMYQLKVVSPLYYLGLNKRYEIFHNKTVDEIIVDILNRYSSLLNLKINVKLDNETYPMREYTTLYNQSDLEFITMLCEEEGYSLIYDYSVENENFFQTPYLITLCELNEHCKEIKNSATGSFNLSKTFFANHIIEDYYDKDKPSLDMKIEAGTTLDSETMKDNESTSQLRSEIKKHNLRDKVNNLDESLFKDLNRYAKISTLREYSQSRFIEGNSEELFIDDSMSVELHDEKAEKNFDVIILEVTYKGFFPNALRQYVQEDTQNKELEYEVNFKAIPKDIIYKPAITIHREKIHSIQTAIVSSGVKQSSKHANEIDVDNEGRIRVLFHFDENNATSTYIRLSNFYSGDGYGSQFLPRVNSEVIVSFINGDIDKPIIIGSLHNGENKHPYNLPKEKTKSFIKTHSIPAHDDQFGYNELSFEDKRGEEVLGLRAQKDFKLHTLNNQYTKIDNNSQTIIGNDKELTVKNNSTQIIGADSTRLIKVNDIKVVEKEEIHTIQEDKELHVLKDFNTIVKDNQKTIVENDMITRVKGILHQYVQDDVKHKFLKNLFVQVGKDYRLDVQNAYHLKSTSIKHTTETFEIEATEGISLRCRGSVLTVDSSGIHLKAPIVDTASGNGGVIATSVPKPVIEKPAYNKIRVTNLTVDMSKQANISDVLTFTAEVEVYENDAWIKKTELTETQKSQLIWTFVKNNEKEDKDILTDNPMNDNITEDGLTMTVNIQEDNIYIFGHAHCYVVDAENEGYAISELKRYLEVDNIIPTGGLDEASNVKCEAILNIEKPRADELAQIRWAVNDKEKAQFNGKDKIEYDMNDESTRSVMFDSYIEGAKEDKAVCELQNSKKEEEKKELKEEKKVERRNISIEGKEG